MSVMLLLVPAVLAACVVIQSVGMLLLIHWLARLRRVIESTSAPRRVALLVRLFLGIVFLHLLQVGLWALIFYYRAPQLPTLEAAAYFSLVTYTTIGFGDIVLGPGWRLLASLEGLTGILLIGWSTAFVFAVVNRMYEHWRRVHDDS
jgi:voltage-gated potassium channel